MERWWDWRERIENELARLDKAGIRYDPPDRIPAEGPLTIRIYRDIDGTERPLDVTFPELYPYFRFTIAAPDLDLAHHRNPVDGVLCLIGRGGSNWLPSDTVARYVTERLPNVVEAGGSVDREHVSDMEEHQAEPASAYLPYEPFAMLLIDGSWELPPEQQFGEIVIGIEERGALLRGAVIRVTDPAGGVVAEADSALAGRYRTAIRGRWARLPKPPATADARAAFDEAERLDHGPRATLNRIGGDSIAVRALVFPEENRWRDSGPNGWAFAVAVWKGAATRQQRRHGGAEPAYCYVRAGRAGRGDTRFRVPELRGLEKRTIAVFGLGCIGAPSALHFARAGIGEIRLVDHDYVDPGTIARWPVGLRYAGLPKTLALRDFINLEWPYTRVVPLPYHVGLTHGDGEVEQLRRAVDGADLVYDATADYGVQRFLGDLARKSGLPYVGVNGTDGGWGGQVIRLRPDGRTGCWWCIQKWRKENEIPEPSGAPDGGIQAQGCGDVTFAAAGFDMETIAVMAVRGAVEFLAPEGGYPAANWDMLIISLRDEDGQPTPPRIDAVSGLRPHPACPNCCA